MTDTNTKSVLLTMESMDQAISGVKIYVDQQDAKSSSDSKTYVDTELARKLDKEFNGENSTIVTSVTAEPNTDADAYGVKITSNVVNAKDGTTEDKSVVVPVVDPAKVTDLQTKMTAVEGKLADVPEGGKAQNNSAALDSLATLTGTGVVTMTAPDTFALKSVDDGMVDPDSALDAAVKAFAAKDGSVKTSSVLDADGKAYVSNSSTAITMGDTNKETVLEAKLDADGKAAIYMRKPDGSSERVAGINEVKALIAAAEAGEATYRGKFTFFSWATSADAAKAAIVDPVADNTAIVFDSTAKTIETGEYTTEWTWTAATWNGGDWAWVEDLLGVPDVPNKASGRVLWDNAKQVFDVFEDREGSDAPDDFGITLNSDGKLSLKMTTDTEKYGATEVSAALNAANIGYGEGKTIAEKIADLEYNIATEEQIEAIVKKYFDTNNPDTPVS